MKFYFRFPLTILCCFFLVAIFTSIADAADDPTAWPEVTADAKPWGYWWWMGSAVDQENIRAEMEAYAASGMGGLHIIPIYGAKGAEDRYIDFLSPKWMEMMHTAVTEAHRVGMDVDWSLCSGWCFGGPWIGADDANSTLRCDVQQLESGKSIDGKFDRSVHQAVAAYGPDRQVVELTDKIGDDGSIDWTVPKGEWRLYVVSQKRSGRNVKRAAPGGAGPMVNPESRRAIEKHLAAFEKAITENSGPLPRASYHDSYEYSCNWSPEVFDLFEKNRGYRLQEHLPALMGEGDADTVARVQHDFRETFAELHVDHFLKPWVDWSHRHGMITRNEAHGSPTNLLDAYAVCDSPETEFFRDDGDELFAKLASSAAHVAGRKFVSAESCTWRNEHFCTTLAEVRNTVCRLMTAGVNHNVFHGTCYSPEDADWPGWCFYASTEYNRRNSIWCDAVALNQYIARCQSVLQSGRPGSDILVYWPIHDMWQQPGRFGVQNLTVHSDWFHKSSLRATAEKLWNYGWQFDYVSDRQLVSARFDEKLGRIVFPTDEAADPLRIGQYHTVIVPPCRVMPLATLRQLIELARGGATVIFLNQLPEDVPGLKDFKQRKAELAELIESLKIDRAFEILHARYGSLNKWIDVTTKAREYTIGCGALFPVGRQIPDNHLKDSNKVLEIYYRLAYGGGYTGGVFDNTGLGVGRPHWTSCKAARTNMNGLLLIIKDVKDLTDSDGFRLYDNGCGPNREEIVEHPNLELIRRFNPDNSIHYFIYNRGNEHFDNNIKFMPHNGASPSSVIVFNPLTGLRGIGLIKPLPIKCYNDKFPLPEGWPNPAREFPKAATLHMRIPAGEATILRVFYSTPENETIPSGLPVWQTYQPTDEPVTLAGTWQVDFIAGGPELPESYSTDRLAPWTDRTEDAETQRFAGTGRYRTTFDAPENTAGRYRIDLGQVADSCRVTINDGEPVTLFGPSYELEGVELKTTGNTIDIEVTNVSANRIRDLDQRGVEWRKFHDINLVNIDYKKFDATGWPIRPAGLIGPVTVTPVTPRP